MIHPSCNQCETKPDKRPKRTAHGEADMQSRRLPADGERLTTRTSVPGGVIALLVLLACGGADAEVTDARGLEALFSRGIPAADAWRR